MAAAAAAAAKKKTNGDSTEVFSLASAVEMEASTANDAPATTPTPKNSPGKDKERSQAATPVVEPEAAPPAAEGPEGEHVTAEPAEQDGEAAVVENPTDAESEPLAAPVTPAGESEPAVEGEPDDGIEIIQVLRNGPADHEFLSGDAYKGEWAENEMHGKGTYEFANGHKYVGEYQNGQRHGQGQLKYASGDLYEGQFEHGAPHGHGTYHYKNHDVYEGGWRNGKRHGQGTYTWGSGFSWKGLWLDNHPVYDEDAALNHANEVEAYAQSEPPEPHQLDPILRSRGSESNTAATSRTASRQPSAMSNAPRRPTAPKKLPSRPASALKSSSAAASRPASGLRRTTVASK